MLTWETLQERLSENDLDAKLIWRLFTIASTHPSYNHRNTPKDLFNLIRQQTLDIR